jgi:hypothetical protein
VFRRAANTARLDTSTAVMVLGRVLAAANDSAPVPQPMSRTLAPGRIAAAVSASTSSHVSCCGG